MTKCATPLKICPFCSCVIPNAVHQCYACGNMQLCWYRRQEKRKAVAKLTLSREYGTARA